MRSSMDWFPTLSIMATVIASTYYIRSEMHEDMRIQSSRTDKLYEMFIDLLKDGKK